MWKTLCALSLVACSGSSGQLTDAVMPLETPEAGTDAGAISVADTGTPSRPTADAGSGGVDAGGGSVDAGADSAMDPLDAALTLPSCAIADASPLLIGTTYNTTLCEARRLAPPSTMVICAVAVFNGQALNGCNEVLHGVSYADRDVPYQYQAYCCVNADWDGSVAPNWPSP